MKIWKLFYSVDSEHCEDIAYWCKMPTIQQIAKAANNGFLTGEKLSILHDTLKVDVMYWTFYLEEIEVIENDFC